MNFERHNLSTKKIERKKIYIWKILVNASYIMLPGSETQAPRGVFVSSFIVRLV